MAMPLATSSDTLKFMQERSCTPLPEAEVRNLFAQLVAAVEHNALQLHRAPRHQM